MKAAITTLLVGVVLGVAAQDRAVRRYHRGIKERGKTCVDCPAEVAHPASG